MSPSSKTCPSCGKPATGNFCQHCGASLGGRFCTQCGAQAEGAARYCSQCGAEVTGGAGTRPAAPAVARGGTAARAPGGPRGASAMRGAQASAPAVGGSNNLAWWIAGVAMMGLILVVGLNMVRPEGPVAPAGGMPPAGGNPAAGQSSVDLNSMTPREAADRLFNRVMQTMSQGDTAGALAFQPMAVQAYELMPDMDLDALVHVALLELLADPAAARATAEKILEQEPDHVIGLGLAAQAADQMGDVEQAAEHYRHVLRVYDTEAARTLPEYDGHRTIMADVRATAEAYLAGR